jgi:phosphoribosylamine--glycine ligase/phosphoribosylformylglycinamidine cyclo-ligase
MLRILLLGSGGREHALAWKLSKSDLVDHIFVCPGNGGTCLTRKTTNLDLSASDFPQLVLFAVQHKVKSKLFPFLVHNARLHQVNLLVPGPEQPLVDGVEEFFRKGTPMFKNRSCLL